MSQNFTVRDLRNRFAEIRKSVETQGEALLLEKGKPRYRITAYSPLSVAEPPATDYWVRLNSYQSRTLTKAQARALHDDNRGER